MAEPRSSRPDRSRVVLGCVLALILGGVSPLLAVFSMLMLAVPVLLAFLYAFAGVLPAVLGGAMTLIMAQLTFGLAGLGMTLCALVLPAAAIISAIHVRAPFHTQLVTAIAALVAGVVAALGVAYAAIGSDIIGAFMGSFRDWAESLGSPGMLDYLFTYVYAIPGAPEASTSAALLAGFLTEAQRADYLAKFISDMHAILALTLPGTLLGSAALSGVLAVAWPGHVLRNEYAEDDPARLPLYRWYTPYRLSLGLLITLGVSYLLSQQKVSGGETVYMTMRAIVVLSFQVQAVASAERRMRGLGAKAPMRAVVIVLALIFFGDVMAVYGGISALFGSTGAARQLMAKRADRQ